MGDLIINPAPVVTGSSMEKPVSVTISGAKKNGSVLTANVQPSTAVVLSYQWRRSDGGVNWADIAGATSSTYTVQPADSAKHITVSVTTKATAVSDALIETLADPYMIASNRLYMPTTRVQATTTALQYQAFAVTMRTPPYPIYDIRFVFPAFVTQSATGEVNLGNDYPFEALWFEPTIGAAGVRMTVGGAQSGIITDGSFAITDPVPNMIPASTDIRIRGAMGPVPLNGYYPSGSYNAIQGALEGSTSGAGSQASRVSVPWPTAPAGYNVGNGYGPCLMVARGWVNGGMQPVVLVVGDSVAWGAGDVDAVVAPYNVYGYVGRGLNAAQVPFANFAVPGTRYSGLVDVNTTDSQTGFAKRKAMLAALDYPYTSILCEMGINTVTNPQGATSADKNAFVVAQAQAAWDYLKTLGNKRVIQTTMTPQSTANINTGGAPGAQNYLNWTTNNASDQFPGSAATHKALDDYIMGNTKRNVDAVIDIRNVAAIDNASGYQLWKLPPDCINATLQEDAAAGQAIIKLDVKPQIGDLLMIAPGATNVVGVYVKDVSGTTAPYIVTLKSNLAVARTAGTVVKGASTADGTHQSPQHARLVAPVITSAVGVQIL